MWPLTYWIQWIWSHWFHCSHKCILSHDPSPSLFWLHRVLLLNHLTAPYAQPMTLSLLGMKFCSPPAICGLCQHFFLARTVKQFIIIVPSQTEAKSWPFILRTTVRAFIVKDLWNFLETRLPRPILLTKAEENREFWKSQEREMQTSFLARVELS